jgi:hypothetical protein
MEGACSTSRWRWPNCSLTATPSPGLMLPPTSGPASSCRLELYQECLATGSWVTVVIEARGGVEQLSISHQLPLPLFLHQPASQESTRPVKRGKPGTEGRGRRG